jgi:hypothetical protein
LLGAYNNMHNNEIFSLKQEFSGDVYSSHGNSQSRGVSIFIKKELKYSIIDVHNDNEYA